MVAKCASVRRYDTMHVRSTAGTDRMLTRCKLAALGTWCCITVVYARNTLALVKNGPRCSRSYCTFACLIFYEGGGRCSGRASEKVCASPNKRASLPPNGLSSAARDHDKWTFPQWTQWGIANCRRRIATRHRRAPGGQWQDNRRIRSADSVAGQVWLLFVALHRRPFPKRPRHFPDGAVQDAARKVHWQCTQRARSRGCQGEVLRNHSRPRRPAGAKVGQGAKTALRGWCKVGRHKAGGGMGIAGFLGWNRAPARSACQIVSSVWETEHDVDAVPLAMQKHAAGETAAQANRIRSINQSINQSAPALPRKRTLAGG